MQTFSAILFLAFSSLVSADEVAIRMVLNGGRKVRDAASCTSTDRELIRSSLLSAGGATSLATESRSLRATSYDFNNMMSPMLCSTFCAGFAPGTCWPVASGCATFERLDEEHDNGIEVAILSDRELDLPELSDLEFSDFNKDEYASCQQKRQAVLHAIHELESREELASPCKPVLKLRIDLACVKIATTV